MVQFYDAVQVHSVTLHSYFSPRSLIGNGRGHERIDKFSVVPAGQKYFPPVFTSFRGLRRPPTVRRAPLPLPLTSFHLLAARTWDVNTWQKRFVPPGLPVSWIMMAPSISPTTPGGPNNPGLRLYKFETTTGQVIINICAWLFIERGYIYIYIPSLPLVSFCSGAGLYSVLS